MNVLKASDHPKSETRCCLPAAIMATPSLCMHHGEASSVARSLGCGGFAAQAATRLKPATAETNAPAEPCWLSCEKIGASTPLISGNRKRLEDL